jgi:5-methylcytosine-specific restriction endonuclease McrA
MRHAKDGADSWGAFQLRFISYRKRPTWSHWRMPPNARGLVSADAAAGMREKGAKAATRLNEAIHRLRRDSRFPKQRSRFGQREMNWIVREHLLPQQVLKTLWAVLIFDRDGYTCQYCSRSVASVWRESRKRRSLGLVVDHHRPRSRRGPSYTFKNSVTACWTCNAIKSTLPMRAFREELKSLARACGVGSRG